MKSAGPSAADTWGGTKRMTSSLAYFTLTTFADGRVLVNGEFNSPLPGRFASVELYVPASGSWSPGTSMAAA